MQMACVVYVGGKNTYCGGESGFSMPVPMLRKFCGCPLKSNQQTKTKTFAETCGGPKIGGKCDDLVVGLRMAGWWVGGASVSISTFLTNPSRSHPRYIIPEGSTPEQVHVRHPEGAAGVCVPLGRRPSQGHVIQTRLSGARTCLLGNSGPERQEMRGQKS